MSERDPFSSGDLLEGPLLDAKIEAIAAEVNPGLPDEYLVNRQQYINGNYAILYELEEFTPLDSGAGGISGEKALPSYRVIESIYDLTSGDRELIETNVGLWNTK